MSRAKSVIRPTILLLAIASWVLVAFSQGVAHATMPPRPGEMARYRADGTYAQRMDFARRMGNNRVHPALVRRTAERLRALRGGGPAPAPNLPYTTSLPTEGSPKIAVLCVDFSDYPHVNDAAVIADKMVGDGDASEAPYESLKNFYARSSYGKLNIGGNVLGWFRAKNPRSAYTDFPGYFTKQAQLIEEVFAAADAQGHDFSQYDNNGDGVIDHFVILWSGPDGGWSSQWWAWNMREYPRASYTIDGKRLGNFTWQWESNISYHGTTEYTPLVAIHESGHALGLPDYYDYDPDVGLDGALGYMDMMDGNWGDHNCFSKWMLGWLTPTAVGNLSQSRKYLLMPSASNPEAVLVMPGADSSRPFSEFFMVQCRTRAGNDAEYPNDGLVIWHLDARLNSYGDDFLYDNSYTAHKLIRLMEADGLEELEKGGVADAGDFYTPGRELSGTSRPNSNDYTNTPTGVYVRSILSESGGFSAVIGAGSGIDLLIKNSTDADTAYALDNVYQATPSGGQIKAQSVRAAVTATYQVKVENEDQATHTWLLKAVEGAGSGWTIVYRSGTSDISAAMRGGGYTTGSLAAGGSEVITVDVTPDTSVAGGARKPVTIQAYMDATDATVRDAVQADTTKAILPQPDLLIKPGGAADSSYASDNVYQATPYGAQVLDQGVVPPTTDATSVKIENDGDAARTFLLRAQESGDPTWTITYKIGNTDISTEMRGAGYTTRSLAVGASDVITVEVTTGNTEGGANKATVVRTYLDANDATVRDSVMARWSVNLLEQADLLIKQGSEPDTAYAIDGAYQTAPDGDQVERQSVNPAASATYNVKLENEGNGTKTFVLKAVESAVPGWTVTYKIGAVDITSQVTAAIGYTTGAIAPRGFQVVTLTMTPSDAVPGGGEKSSTLNLFYNASDATVRDCVQAVTTLKPIARADLLIKSDTDAESAFAIDNAYQTTASGQQIEQQSTNPDVPVVYDVKIENDGNTAGSFTLKAQESGDNSWAVSYRIGSEDVTALITTGDGYPTPSLAAHASLLLTVSMTPTRSVPGGSSKSSTILALSGAETDDVVQAVTTVNVVIQPDMLVKAGAEPETAYTIDGTYQTTPAGNQIERQNVDPNAAAVYQVKVQNDGNTNRTYVVKATQSAEPGWTVAYAAGTKDITANLNGGTGYTTAILVPGDSEVITVTMTPDSSVIGGTRKSAVLTASGAGWDGLVLDAVQVESTANTKIQPDLLIKAASDPEAAFAIAHNYQATPTGAQSVSQMAAPGATATYLVKVANDNNAVSRTFLVKAVNPGTSGWTVAYQGAGGDIAGAIQGAGYQTGILAPGQSELITVAVTASAGVAGGASTAVTLNVFLDAADTTVRDAVQVRAVAETVAQPDLLIKKAADADTAYASTHVYQEIPLQKQVLTQATPPGTKIAFAVRVSNDGNAARTFTLKAVEGGDSGWTVAYKRGSTDIGGAMRGAGAPTRLLSAGSSEVITVEMTPGATTPAGASRTTTIQAYLDGADMSVRDVVEATGVVSAVHRPDLLVKRDAEDVSKYTANNGYQETPTASQTRTQTVSQDATATYQVKIENDGNTTRSFLLRAGETVAAGWTVLYRLGDMNVTRQIRTSVGYTTPEIEPGSALVLTVDMTPDRMAASDVVKSATIKAYVDGRDTTVDDSVLVTSSVRGVIQPDLLIKKDTDGQQAYAIDNAYQTRASGYQISTQEIQAGTRVNYYVKIENDGNSARTFVLKSETTAATGWSIYYRLPGLDVTPQMTSAEGYETPVIRPRGSLTLVVSLTPARTLPGKSSNSVTVKVFRDAADTLARDAVTAKVVVAAVQAGPVLRLRAAGAGMETMATLSALGVQSDEATGRSVDLRFVPLPPSGGPRRAGSRAWEFAVEAPAPDTSVTLTWPELPVEDAGAYTLTITDADANVQRTMAATAAYTFRAGDGLRRRFRVTAERLSMAGVAITGLDVMPTRSGARVVTVTLSAAASVDLDVLAPSGKVVATVARGRAAVQGVNQLFWSGTVAPGLYLVRATATAGRASIQSMRPVVITR